MSDNDLIKRGTAMQSIRETLLEDDESYGAALWAIENCPAAPREMSAREYENGWRSLCTTYSKYLCKGCPLDDGEQCGVPTKYHCVIVEKWEREHPERSKE